MAVTKIWDVRGRLDQPIRYVENPEKTENPDYGIGTDEHMNPTDPDVQSLTDVMRYAENEEKTEYHFYVSGVNCYSDTARDQFLTVKQQFAKEGGIIAYHAYQSFAPEETTPEVAHQIGVELAQKLWGDRFQVVVATHLNTHCLHNHFVINSVSYRDGKRYHDCKETYRLLQKTSDEICKAHGLSVIEHPSGERHSRRANVMTEKKEPTCFALCRQAVDEAIRESRSMFAFEKNLRAKGYRVQTNPNRKYWTITPMGDRRPIRMKRLGEDYTNERIEERIREQSWQPETPQKPQDQNLVSRLVSRTEEQNSWSGLASGTEDQIPWGLLASGTEDQIPRSRFTSEPVRRNPVSLSARRRKDTYPRAGHLPKGAEEFLKMTSSLYRRYLYYCYLLGAFPEYPRNVWKVPVSLRKDLVHLRKLQEEVHLLGSRRIGTMEELDAYEAEITEQMDALADRRREVAGILRRKLSEEDAMELKQERSELTAKLKDLRHQKKLMEDIRERSCERMQTLERAIREEKTEDKKGRETL